MLSRLRSRQNMNILSRVCMNLKIHAFKIETVIFRCYNFCYRANLLSKVSLNLKIHSYNPDTVIVRCNGATIFVIALKI